MLQKIERDENLHSYRTHKADRHTHRGRDKEKERDHCKLTICNQIQPKKKKKKWTRRKTHNGEKTTKNFNFTLCFSSTCTFSTFLPPNIHLLSLLSLSRSGCTGGRSIVLSEFSIQIFLLHFPNMRKYQNYQLQIHLHTHTVRQTYRHIARLRTEIERKSNIIARVCFCFITNRFHV